MICGGSYECICNKTCKCRWLEDYQQEKRKAQTPATTLLHSLHPNRPGKENMIWILSPYSCGPMLHKKCIEVVLMGFW